MSDQVCRALGLTAEQARTAMKHAGADLMRQPTAEEAKLARLSECSYEYLMIKLAVIRMTGKALR